MTLEPVVSALTNPVALSRLPMLVYSLPSALVKSPLPATAVANVNVVPVLEVYLALLPSGRCILPIFGKP